MIRLHALSRRDKKAVDGGDDAPLRRIKPNPGSSELGVLVLSSSKDGWYTDWMGLRIAWE